MVALSLGKKIFIHKQIYNSKSFFISDFVQTPMVRAETGKDLKLESPTRSLEIQASQEIFIQSRAGKRFPLFFYFKNYSIHFLLII